MSEIKIISERWLNYSVLIYSPSCCSRRVWFSFFCGRKRTNSEASAGHSFHCNWMNVDWNFLQNWSEWSIHESDLITNVNRRGKLSASNDFSLFLKQSLDRFFWCFYANFKAWNLSFTVIAWKTANSIIILQAEIVLQL